MTQSISHPMEKPESVSKLFKDDSFSRYDNCMNCYKRIRTEKRAPIARIVFSALFFFAGLIQILLCIGHIIISKNPNGLNSVYSGSVIGTACAVMVVSILKILTAVTFAIIQPNKKNPALVVSGILLGFTFCNVIIVFIPFFVVNFLHDLYYIIFIIVPITLWFVVAIGAFLYSLVTRNTICNCEHPEREMRRIQEPEMYISVDSIIGTYTKEKGTVQDHDDVTKKPIQEDHHDHPSNEDVSHDSSTKPSVTKQVSQTVTKSKSKTNTRHTEPVLPDKPLQMEEGYDMVEVDDQGGDTEVTVYDNVEDSEKVPIFRRAPSKGMRTAERIKVRKMASKQAKNPSKMRNVDDEEGKKRLVTAIEKRRTTVEKRKTTELEKKRSETALEKKRSGTALEQKRSATALEKKRSLTALEKKKSGTALDKKAAPRKMATAVPRKKATIVSTYLN